MPSFSTGASKVKQFLSVTNDAGTNGTPPFYVTLNGIVGVLGEGVDNTEAKVQMAVPIGGTFRNLYCQFGATGSGTTAVLTLRKNGAGTALTITAVNTATLVTDTTHSVAVVAGDLVCWEWSVAGPNVYVIAIEFDPA